MRFKRSDVIAQSDVPVVCHHFRQAIADARERRKSDETTPKLPTYGLLHNALRPRRNVNNQDLSLKNLSAYS